MKKRFLYFFVLTIMLFGVKPSIVNATDAHECTYVNDEGKLTVTLYKGTYAGEMRSKIKHHKFKDAFFNGGDEWDQNMTSQAKLQASGICPQAAIVVKKSQVGLDDYIIYTGDLEEVKAWREKTYPDEKNYEISKLDGSGKNLIDRMNQVNEHDHTWYGYNSKKECKYNNGNTIVNIYGNYFKAVEFLGEGEQDVCPNYIYQYCDSKDPTYCAYSFYPQKQYLCDYTSMTCKKIDVNGITGVRGEEETEVDPTKKNLNLNLEKNKGGYENELSISIERDKDNNIKTVLKFPNNKTGALVGNKVSVERIQAFLNDDVEIANIYCLTYDIFANKRDAERTHTYEFSGGNLKDYSYVCVLGAEESLVWTNSLDSAAKYTTNSVNDMELLSWYNRLNDLAKYPNCDNLTGEEAKNCFESQNFLYETSVNIKRKCQNYLTNLSYTCDTTTPKDVKDCKDNCCVCKKMNTIIDEYANKGYFGNRIIKDTNSGGCTETLGALGSWLTRIYKILLLAVPVIIVAFGFKDFIQAMGAGKEDELKKVGSTFIKRLILGAIFVALPILVKFILTVALGGDVANMCIF